MLCPSPVSIQLTCYLVDLSWIYTNNHCQQKSENFASLQNYQLSRAGLASVYNTATTWKRAWQRDNVHDNATTCMTTWQCAWQRDNVHDNATTCMTTRQHAWQRDNVFKSQKCVPLRVKMLFQHTNCSDCVTCESLLLVRLTQKLSSFPHCPVKGKKESPLYYTFIQFLKNLSFFSNSALHSHMSDV